MPNYSGYKDRNGTPINEGDIVRFYNNYELGYSDEPNEEYTEIIDLCWQDVETGLFYLICDIGFGSYVYRHNKNCEVIGNIDLNKELLKFDKELWELLNLDEYA